MSMATRLLLVGNDADYFFSHRLPIALAAHKAGYEVNIAIPLEKTDKRIYEHPFVFHCVAINRGGMHPLQEIKSIFSLYTLYKQLRPDIVHHVTIKPTLYGGIVARLAGIPNIVNAMTGLGFVFMSKDIRVRLLRKVITYFLKFSCAKAITIFQNPDDRALFQRLGICSKEKTILIRGSGVDELFFKPKSFPPGEVKILFPSRLLWDKGIREFIDAARILKKKGCSAIFVLVGGTDPNPTSVPEKIVREWVERGDVEWWGWSDNMPEMFSSCHIVCLPSYREGLPKVLIEAAACERPIVTTDVPGCREIVIHDKNGILVPAGQAGPLAQALEILINDEELRVEMGKCGRALVEKEFTLSIVIKATLDLYSDLLLKSVCRHARN